MTTVALLSWPLFALIIFANARLIPAIIAATLVPYLYLPEAVDIPLPGLPDLDKTAVISVSLLMGLMLFGKKTSKKGPLPARISASPTVRLLFFSFLGIIVSGTILTVLNNREWLVFGPTVLPGMRAWDAISLFGNLALLLTPYLIARRYFASPVAHRALLKAFVYGGLVYSLLMLVEIRLSPQLHNWVYGYHQHSFLQHIRDGFRPMVFMEHGLWVGFFIFMSLMSAVALWRAEKAAKWLIPAGWLFVILMISENLGAFAIGLMCLGILVFLVRRMQIWAVVAIAFVTLTYPALRQAELVPLDRILSAAESVSAERAQSLEFRLRNEDLLLQRAYEKPLTGWGGWARDRIYNERGEDISISEGYWILILGAWGWFGYIGFFGLLALPLITLLWVTRRKTVPIETLGLALICAGNLIYMIPNATLTPIGLLCFGALVGFAQFDVQRSDDLAARSKQDRSVDLRYTRFPQATDRLARGKS